MKNLLQMKNIIQVFHIYFNYIWFSHCKRTKWTIYLFCFAESILCCLLDDEEEICNNKLTNIKVSYFVILSTELKELTRLKNRSFSIVFIPLSENVSLESLAKIAKTFNRELYYTGCFVSSPVPETNSSLRNRTVVWWKRKKNYHIHIHWVIKKKKNYHIHCRIIFGLHLHFYLFLDEYDGPI